MTVGTQLQQAIAGVQSAAAIMKTVALETEDREAKLTVTQLTQNLDDAVQKLKQRQQYLESTEQVYK